MVLKKLRQNRTWLKFILMGICSFLLVSHVYEFTELMRYEDIPDYINVYNPDQQLQDYSEINLSINIDQDLYITNYSNYNNVSSVYRVEQDLETQRDVKLLNIMFDLFLISLLWHSKVKDEEED